MTTLSIDVLLTPAVAQISRRYQQAFASECHCGQEGCPGSYVPPPHDYRVLAMTLAAGIGVVRELRQRGQGRELDVSNKLVTALDHHARTCADAMQDRQFAGDVLAQVRRFCGETPLEELVDTETELRASDFDPVSMHVLATLLGRDDEA